jgi:hypothetical protein
MMMAVALVLAASVAAGPPVDPYADAVSPSTTAMVVDPDNALGVPDGRIATVTGHLGAWFVLDLGAGEEGVGNLDFSYFEPQFLADQTDVELRDANGRLVVSQTVVLFHGNRVVTVANTSPNPYRFVWIRAGQVQRYGVDAVTAAGLA